MKQLDHKSIWLFFAEYLSRATFLAFMLIIVMGRPILTLVYGAARSRTMSLESLISSSSIFVFVLITIVISFVWAYLTWYFYRYELRENGFYKEMGIIWKAYVTIPYDRIQNVDVFRGVIARILGLSDIQIQTAGMSAPVKGGVNAEGRLQGLTFQDAETVRDELIKRSRLSRSGGI